MTAGFWGAIFYFFCFSTVGCWFSFLNLHYADVGLGKSQIGVLAALSTLMLLVASPIWTGVANKLRLHKRLLTEHGNSGTISVPSVFSAENSERP
jgi:hypothetical protein